MFQNIYMKRNAGLSTRHLLIGPGLVGNFGPIVYGTLHFCRGTQTKQRENLFRANKLST